MIETSEPIDMLEIRKNHDAMSTLYIMHRRNVTVQNIFFAVFSVVRGHWRVSYFRVYSSTAVVSDKCRLAMFRVAV